MIIPIEGRFLARMDSRRVGCVGGGQLGRMMAEAAHRLSVRMAAVENMC